CFKNLCFFGQIRNPSRGFSGTVLVFTTKVSWFSGHQNQHCPRQTKTPSFCINCPREILGKQEQIECAGQRRFAAEQQRGRHAVVFRRAQKQFCEAEDEARCQGEFVRGNFHCGEFKQSMNQDFTESWYCARTKPKCEHIAAANLGRNLGLEVFNPRLRMERSTRRGLVRTVEPLFPCYVFVKCPDITLNEVRY